MIQRIISVWAWLAIIAVCLVWLPLLGVLYLLTSRSDPGRYLVGRWFRLSAVTAAKLNPLWRFRTSGVHVDDPRRPYVAVSNHESLADIFLISHLSWEMKWLAKAELFRIPLLGWNMRLAGDIPVGRSSRKSRIEALMQCRDRLEKKVSVMIFPEGTRSETGELLPFHDGAFRLAIDAGVPILPLAVVGTRDAVAKGSLVFGRADAEVRALEPIPTDNLTVKDVGTLRDQVRERIRMACEEMRRGTVPSTGRAT